MSIILINPDDTITISDDIVVKTAKAVEVCQPIIQETETIDIDNAIAIRDIVNPYIGSVSTIALTYYYV